MSLPIGGPNRQAFFPSGAPGVPLERESHLATTSSTGLRRFEVNRNAHDDDVYWLT